MSEAVGNGAQDVSHAAYVDRLERQVGYLMARVAELQAVPQLAELRARLPAEQAAATAAWPLAPVHAALSETYPEFLKRTAPPPFAEPLKLDLGCGTRKTPGFLGVDCRQFPGVDVVADLTQPWPWADGSVIEVNASHFVEHLKPAQRIHFVNELYRVLKTGGKATIITPHWCSHRAYGDLTHEWPPVSEMWFAYLNKAWRAENAPHGDTYTCDFDLPPVSAVGFNPALGTRSEGFKQEAAQWYKEAIWDLMTTVTKGPR